MSLRSLLSKCLSFVLILSLSNPASATQFFDFIIVGGGTSGLTVANRLSELPNITVAIIEAGNAQENNPNITVIGDYGISFGTSIDWVYLTVNQTHGDDKRVVYNSGKVLGGTSCVNGMVYLRAEKSQIDAWETIGNEGWNWDNLFPYYKRSENFTHPTIAQSAAGASFIPGFHGESGSLKTGFPFDLLNGSFHDTISTSWNALNLPPNLDANSGHMRGFYLQPSTIDVDENVREDAARAFYYPVQSRPNLFLFVNTTVNRIVWDEQTSGAPRARGVEVTASNGSVYEIGAKREVILSAGALRSPAILELSGVGNRNIIEKFGIASVLDLPAVGENLQDQINAGLIYSAKSNVTISQTPYVTYATAYDYFGDDALSIAKETEASLKSWAEIVAIANNNSISAVGLEYLMDVQHDLIFKKSISSAEILSNAVGDHFGGTYWGLVPFSRGNVHIQSSNPLAYPAINPNYFLLDFDGQVAVAIAKFIRKFWSTTKPISDSVIEEVIPGLGVVPLNATNAQWLAWIKTAYTTNSHPLGTAAMMPKELGGVVSSSLKVYGLSNVRVIDASVLPFQPSGHLTANLYALSERVADMIKADLRCGVK